MFCKECGNRIEDTWKVCPNCGTALKGGMEETGDRDNYMRQKDIQIVKKKKTVYKKWWFWVLMVFICIIGLAVIGGSDDNETKVEKEEKATVDFSEMDLADFLGKSEEDLKAAGFKESEEYLGYGALDGDVQISFTEGEIDFIIISGKSDKTPAFSGVKLGMEEEEAYGLLMDGFPKELGDTDGKMFANLDTKGSVRCQSVDGKISTIMYMLLTDAEVEDYQTTKEEYIFSDSDTRYLSEEEVRQLEAEKLAIARNEIFARHGYIFKDENFKEYFESTSWYEGIIEADQFNSDSIFNDFEKKNVELIKQIEDEMNGVEQGNAEQQQAIDNAYNFLVGHSFHLQDSQPLMVFESYDTIRYCWGGNIEDDYFNYSISARYEDYKDDLKEWLTFLTIDGEEYYLRTFTNGSINLGSTSGYGELDGWYELYE